MVVEGLRRVASSQSNISLFTKIHTMLSIRKPSPINSSANIQTPEYVKYLFAMTPLKSVMQINSYSIEEIKLSITKDINKLHNYQLYHFYDHGEVFARSKIDALKYHIECL